MTVPGVRVEAAFGTVQVGQATHALAHVGGVEAAPGAGLAAQDHAVGGGALRHGAASLQGGSQWAKRGAFRSGDHLRTSWNFYRGGGIRAMQNLSSFARSMTQTAAS